MPAKKSELTKEQNLPGVKDELGKDITEEAKLNAQKELEHFRENIEKIKEAKERFKDMWERDDELYHIMMNNPRKLASEITYEYEKNDRYWEIRKEQLVDKYNEDKYMAIAKLKQYDTQLEQINEQIASTKEMLDDLNEVDE